MMVGASFNKFMASSISCVHKGSLWKGSYISSVTNLVNGKHRSYSSASEDSRNELIEALWKIFTKRISEISTVKASNNRTLYQEGVINLLEEKKKEERPLTYSDLRHLQVQIENMTMLFDETSVFKTSSSLIDLLIGKEMVTAKVYLNQNKGLSEQDLSLIRVFGTYTLEANIIHVLGAVFHILQEPSLVRVATLIAQIDYAVRVQADVLMGKEKHELPLKINKEKKVTRTDYAIGVALVEFLVERKLVTLKTIDSEELKGLEVSKKKGYVKNCFVMCNFDLSLLPTKLNLPMVVEPIPWSSNKEEAPQTFDDISGGYLCTLTGEMYNRFRFLTSTCFHDFFIKFNDPTLLCSVLNQLQAQPFQICKDVLDFIDLNRDFLEEEGLLMNRCLANVNLEEASRLLRHCYFFNEGVQEVVSFDTLLTDLPKRVQRARYESFVLTLARAYAGYQFYLPAFMDFRGRMYRAGVSLFHERDLAECLICFASNKKTEKQSHDLRMTLEAAAAFKFQKFQTVEQASLWYREYCQDKIVSDKSLILLAKQASDPFQFLGKVLANERDTALHCVPVTQGASASAYQIMSYLLLNKELGMHTNLLPSPDNKIQDFYVFLKDELLVFLHSRLNSYQYALIESGFTREITELLYMPSIYGKTVIAMASDIRQFNGLLSNKESYHIAQLCKEFWSQKYPDIVNLMKLLNLIGWWCSVSDLPVLYSTHILTTVQDYRKSSISEIRVYNRISKKRCRVSLTVPMVERDSRKTQVATCMNFIDQIDAYIAMKVVEQLQLMKAPICTVHDNFVTTAEFAAEIPTIYTNVFMEMGHPFKIINSFLIDNLNRKGLDVPSDSPLPGDYIRDLLRDLVKDISPKDKIWDQKIEETVASYLEYVRTACV